MKKFLILPIHLFILFSCNQPQTKTGPGQQSEERVVAVFESPAKGIERFVIAFPGTSELIRVPASRRTEVKGKKGIKLLIDPANLETINGDPLVEVIDIELKEITNQEGLLKNNAPTVSGDRLLVSGGAYYIGMSSAGNPLKLKQNRSLKIVVPKISNDEMELFYGQRDPAGNLNWLPAGQSLSLKKQVVADVMPAADISTDQKEKKDTSAKDKPERFNLEELFAYATARNNKLSASEFDSFVTTNQYGTTISDTNFINTGDAFIKVIRGKDSITGARTKTFETVYYKPLEIRSLGWINCDRFYNSTKRAELQCEFDSSFQSFTLYTVFRSMNAMISETISRKDPAAIVSLNNFYPAGQRVKLVAFTSKDGKFYSCEQELTLGERETIQLNFSPAKETDLVRQSSRIY